MLSWIHFEIRKFKVAKYRNSHLDPRADKIYGICDHLAGRDRWLLCNRIKIISLS